MDPDQEQQSQPQEGAPQSSTDGAEQSKGDKPATQPKGNAARRGRTLEQRAAVADSVLGKVLNDEVPGDKPAKKPEAKPDATEKPEAKPADAKPAGKLELPETSKTALASLLKDGKLAELAEQLGVDKKAVDASGTKLALGRKREAVAAHKLEEAKVKEQKAEDIRAECKRVYGPPHKIKTSVDKGDFVGAAQAIADAAGIDFATLTRKVAEVTKGMDPKELERWTKDRELRAREEALAAKETKIQTEKTETERQAKAQKTIAIKCAGHDVLKLPKGAGLVLAKLEENFNSETGELKMGYAQAADAVLQEFDATAKALGYSKGAAAPAPAKAETEQKPAGKREFQPPRGAQQEPASSDGKRRGSSFEDRAARAERQFQRSRPA